MARTKRRDTGTSLVRQGNQLKSVGRLTLGALGIAGALNASASLVTINQALFGDYSYDPPCADLQGDVCFSGTPVRTTASVTTQTNAVLNANGQSELDATGDVEGASQVVANWSIDVDNGGKVKTYSNLRVAGSNSPSDLNIPVLTNIDVTARNQISFFDRVSSTDEDGAIFRFETRITGEFDSTRDYQTQSGVDPIGLYPSQSSGLQPAVFEHEVEITAGTSVDSDRATNRRDATFVDPAGSQPGGQFVISKRPVDFTLKFIDILKDADGTAIFAFDFSDQLRFELNNPDGNYWAIGMANELQNTITTYASVYDKDLNLLPDARVMSSAGFSYAPLSDLNGEGNGGSASVPVPAPAFLIAAGLLGMRLRRR